MRRTFYYDQSRCMSCNACTVACKDWNQVNPGPVRWRRQETYEVQEGEGLSKLHLYNLSMSCNHCEKPACKEACSVGAIMKREDGVVYVDKTKCEGLTACIMACPFSAPHIAEDKQEPTKSSAWKIDHPMQKCDFCRTRLDEGKQPVCVAACPANALDSGDFFEMLKKYPDAQPLSVKQYPYAYSNNKDEGTRPSFLIKRRKIMKIVKAVEK